ncbi:hypothetical protein GCM10022215_37660 [Nocardioides fonticola]|uniref:Uncharacterized protein n=1 Tax=Nocardioides fonticola TaxID=450363 RepID=A0ABP7XXF9_9ACTN
MRPRRLHRRDGVQGLREQPGTMAPAPRIGVDDEGQLVVGDEREPVLVGLDPEVIGVVAQPQPGGLVERRVAIDGLSRVRESADAAEQSAVGCGDGDQASWSRTRSDSASVSSERRASFSAAFSLAGSTKR